MVTHSEWTFVHRSHEEELGRLALFYEGKYYLHYFQEPSGKAADAPPVAYTLSARPYLSIRESQLHHIQPQGLENSCQDLILDDLLVPIMDLYEKFHGSLRPTPKVTKNVVVDMGKTTGRTVTLPLTTPVVALNQTTAPRTSGRCSFSTGCTIVSTKGTKVSGKADSTGGGSPCVPNTVGGQYTWRPSKTKNGGSQIVPEALACTSPEGFPMKKRPPPAAKEQKVVFDMGPRGGQLVMTATDAMHLTDAIQQTETGPVAIGLPLVIDTTAQRVQKVPSYSVGVQT